MSISGGSLFLLFAAAGVAPVAVVLGHRGSRGLPVPGLRWVKTTVPLLLLLAVGTAPAFLSGSPPLSLVLIAAGMAATVLADWFLAPADNSSTFAAGLATFLIGYFLYGAAFLVRALSDGDGSPVVFGCYLAAALAGWLQWRRLLAVPQSLKGAVVAYVAVASHLLAAGVAQALLDPTPASFFMAAAALMIYGSDSLIAHNLFRRRLPAEELWILPPYYLGQLAVAVGILSSVGF